MNTEKLKDLHLGNRLKEKLDTMPRGSQQRLLEHLELSRQGMHNKLNTEDFKLKDLLHMLEFLQLPLDEFLGIENIKGVLSERYQKGLEMEHIEKLFQTIDRKLDQCIEGTKIGANTGQLT